MQTSYGAVFREKIFPYSPHDEERESDECDEDASDADHGEHPVVQLGVVWIRIIGRSLVASK